MIRKGLYFAILSLLCITLIILTVVLWKQKDREAPVISLPMGEISYTEGDPEEGLLLGVSARDNVDGDLSSRVFVYEVLPIRALGQAKVVFAVCDSSMNVGTAELMVNYERKKEKYRFSESGEPVLRLKRYGTTLKKGEVFDPHDYVASVSDDKDEEEELLRQLNVKGNYDLTKTGHYRLHMYVCDSDGNESKRAEFLLVVE
ncbi:MAG: DUF5011 domain-containing protein [Lachnospiraceae bacterium]|nr:DUF5011 domain-containing protein [Lachnospiraceae bacterium]